MKRKEGQRYLPGACDMLSSSGELLHSHPCILSTNHCIPLMRFCAWLGLPSDKWQGLDPNSLYLPESEGPCSTGVRLIFSFSGDEQSVRAPGGLLPEHLSRAQTLLGKGNRQTDSLPRIRGVSPGKKCTEKVCGLFVYFLVN